MVTLFVGTVKGAFVFRSADRRAWAIEGPVFKGWQVTAATRTGAGRYLAAIASPVYGPSIHSGGDLVTWKQVKQSPAWPEGGKRKMNQTWTISAAGDALYAGVDEAGLFRSADGGETWSPVEALNEHRTRGSWFPGAGGLCAHSVLHDPKYPRRLWCGISAVGVFRSDDAGGTWVSKNDGVPAVIEDKEHKDIGFCVHGLVPDPDDADTIWRQDHAGMFRTRDGGDSWERIQNGLSSRFGFPIALDRGTKALYAVPLESDEYRVPIEGKLRVFRSRNGGDAWEPLGKGLPQAHCYTGVLRGALVTDSLSPCGVYFGTTNGQVFASADAGETWEALPVSLPRVLCVAAFA